ncbi:hypothetical protein EDC65_2668 [Stella humosa]|uniref:YCII-related domain-containing protein n=1 Tax=Stella humosa TaxID=94 RepID=A0A3N1LIX1_9PROT|nr:hypothetical protein [Stella humosa]ROP90809.1 hypothetical protein EDC65_2668 [Stella humosa]BBK34845.1 hypothetical protein STHU_54790 [Stella humosa]
MDEFILLMHGEVGAPDAAWGPYLARLRESGAFAGGSAIGDGICVSKEGTAAPVTAHLIGYIRVNAAGIEDVRALLVGNPHFEAGGTVEIRRLPRTG